MHWAYIRNNIITFMYYLIVDQSGVNRRPTLYYNIVTTIYIYSLNCREYFVYSGEQTRSRPYWDEECTLIVIKTYTCIPLSLNERWTI